MENKKSDWIPMGLGELGKSEMVFARCFRFKLEGQNLPPHFVKDVQIDYHNRTLKFSCYDVLNSETKQGLHGLRWASQMEKNLLHNETLTLTTYNGCGEQIYSVEFTNLSIFEHSSNFDYSSSEISTQYIAVKFENYIVNFAPSQDSDTKHEVGCHTPKITWIADIDIKNESNMKNVKVYLDKRPNVTIEETEINYLNEKMFIPGKARWESLTICFDNDDFHTMINRSFDMKLTLFIDNKPVEKWNIKECWASDVRNRKVVINYTNLSFESCNRENK